MQGLRLIMAKIEMNKVFKEFNRTKCRYRLAKGSAGSGKSVDIATDFILKLSDSKYKGANLLVVRQTETSHKDSTFAELLSAINRCGLSSFWTYTVMPLSLTCKATGNMIIFRGFSDQRARERVKSINFPNGKLVWIWCEEATELQEADVDILDDRLRGRLDNPNLYYQMTFSFNPISSSHWIKRKYWDYESPDIFKCQSTYLDNRFLDENYHKRMMMRKEQDPEGYQIYGLGEWGELGGLILTNYVIEDICTDFDRYDNVLYAQDFGFNHANAILEIGFKDDEIYVLRELYVHEKDTEEIIQLAEDMQLDKHKKMWCDSAEPDRIKMWKKAGYKAEGVKKESGSVNAQIDYLKQHKIHINGCCINTIKEIQQWKWQKDSKTGLYIDTPCDFQDDAMAALRYSVETYRRNKKMKTMSKSMLGL
ncbi:MAG: PBSX family phage terminase large subunit [Lachnospiraceae bacterium]|nr:PBSX family phage terminase large subunit [Lachnospiraceae bacterium]